MKYENRFRVSSSHINRFGELSTSSMFYRMQEIAWEHADKIGFGYDHLKKDQLFWVLSRLMVKTTRIPDWGEDLILETCSRGTDGFFAYRDYRFIDGSGTIVITATTSWLVLDAATKRIRRLNDFHHFPAYKESIFGREAAKIETPATECVTGFTPVLFNEIDINQHFNTGRYLERIIDGYGFTFHNEYILVEFEVNFLKEGMPDDHLALKILKIDRYNHLCSVVRESDGSDLVRARLVWKDRIR